VKELDKQDGQAWEDNSIVCVNRRIYISNNKKIQEQILQENYNPADIGHPGQQKMIKLIKINYWWPEIKEDVKKYVQRCMKCQQNKVQHQKKARELHLLEIPEEPWQKISINIIGPLPQSKGKNAIVVIVDQFTKIIQLKAITTTVLS